MLLLLLLLLLLLIVADADADAFPMSKEWMNEPLSPLLMLPWSGGREMLIFFGEDLKYKTKHGIECHRMAKTRMGCQLNQSHPWVTPTQNNLDGAMTILRTVAWRDSPWQLVNFIHLLASVHLTQQ